jgi:hypothetical protein
MVDVRARMLVMRSCRLVRAANRERRRRLRSELSAYTTRRELDDVYAVLARCSDAQTRELREVLAGPAPDLRQAVDLRPRSQ